MMPCVNGINACATGFPTQKVDQSFGNTINTTYGGDYPYFVSHTDIAILTAVALECSILLLDSQFLVNRIIGVLSGS